MHQPQAHLKYQREIEPKVSQRRIGICERVFYFLTRIRKLKKNGINI